MATLTVAQRPITAFTASTRRSTPPTPTRGRGSNLVRSAVIDRPGLDIGTAPGTPSTETGRGSGATDRNKNTGGGSHRVILLKSDKHTRDRVIQAICTVIPGVDEAHAENCYLTSESLGMALVTACLKEHAEFYAQQLFRYGCRATIEPDTTVL